jgi:hypothetical protein
VENPALDIQQSALFYEKSLGWKTRLYLNDGFAVFKPKLWNAPEIVSHLIAENKIPEIILVGVDNAAIPGCERLRDQIKAASPSTNVRLHIGKGDDHSSKVWSRRLPYALEFLFGSSAQEE